MRKWTGAALACGMVVATGVSAPAALAASGLHVIRGLGAWTLAAGQAVLYSEGDLAVTADLTAPAATFRDVYVVNMSNRLSGDSLARYGDLLDLEPRHFALMRLKPSQVPALAAKLHREGLACGVLTKLDRDFLVEAEAPAPTPVVPTSQRDARIAALTSKVSEAALTATIASLAEVPTRFPDTASGQSVAALLAQKYQALRAGRSDVTIKAYDHGEDTAQNSLIVRIEGTSRADETVIIGSHLDSVNWRDGNSERAPGADDNASGTATNLEIFRLLMQHQIKPSRSIEIHAYAAEEAGLLGSKDLAKAYLARGAKVIAMMQFDMDLYTAPGEERKIWLVSNNTSAPLNAMLGQLIDHYVGLPWEERYLSAGSSDHASWYRAGFATAFPFENPDDYNHAIHSGDDDLARSGDSALAAAFAKLGAAYLLHFAGFDGVFAVDTAG